MIRGAEQLVRRHVPMGVVAMMAASLWMGCGPQKHSEAAPRWMTEKQTVRMEIVETLLEGGETLQALELIRLMRADGVDEPQLDLLQGVAMRQQGMVDQAEALLVKAEGRDGKNPAVWRELCVLYADDARTEDAISACEHATELDDGNAKAWNNLGFLYLTAASDPAAAKRALQRAVALDATQARYRNNLAYAQAADGDHRAALRTFLTTGTPADAHYNVGTAFERAGDLATAKTYYRRALKMDADHLYADEALRRLDEAPRPAQEN